MLANAPGGIDGQVSKAWRQATDPAVSGPTNSPERLTETSSGARPLLARGDARCTRRRRVLGNRRRLLRHAAAALPPRRAPGAPRARLRRPDARRPRLGRARALAARGARLARRPRAVLGRAPARPRAAAGTPSASGSPRWPRSRSCSGCTPRSTGPGSSPATSLPALLCAGWSSSRAARCASGVGRRSAPAPPGRRALRARGRALVLVLGAHRRLERAAAACARRTRRTPRSSGSTAARSRRRRRSRGSRTSATRWRSTRCSSWPRSSRRAGRNDAGARERSSRRSTSSPRIPETWRRLGQFRLNVLNDPDGRAAAPSRRRTSSIRARRAARPTS